MPPHCIEDAPLDRRQNELLRNEPLPAMALTPEDERGVTAVPAMSEGRSAGWRARPRSSSRVIGRLRVFELAEFID
jgi:hypothetical protein